MELEKVIHYPDLFFKDYIHQIFGLNRGIYNVIDQWFYRENYKDILSRRRIIIEFLNESIVDQSDKKFYVGRGNLSEKLKQFNQRACGINK